MAAALLLRLEALNGRDEYKEIAQETMETFAGVVEHFGLYAATYGLALQRMLQRPIQVMVVGEGAEARQMEMAALARYAVNKSVVRVRVDQMGELPPLLAETLPFLPDLPRGAGESCAVVCSGTTCKPPVRSVAELVGVMNSSV